MFNFLKIINSDIGEAPLVPDMKIYTNKIPDDVLSLLWFSDGPLKNYQINSNDSDTINNYSGFWIKVGSSGKTLEPSCISLKYPIGSSSQIPDSPDYYPTYSRLTPEQRRIYLTWLQDIDQPVDLGYVFLFYYGLERHLYYSDKFEEAFNMVLRLRNHHSNSTFPAYSYSALICSSIIRNRPDLIKNLIEYDKTEYTLAYACKALLNIPITSDEIIELSGLVGFKNKRYIKNEYHLFKSSLEKFLMKRNSSTSYYIKKEYLQNCRKQHIFTAANFSFDTRNIEIMDVTSNQLFKNELLELLQATHNQVKSTLREQRKLEGTNSHC